MREQGPAPLPPWRRRRLRRLGALMLLCLAAWAVAVWLLVRWLW